MAVANPKLARDIELEKAHEARGVYDQAPTPNRNPAGLAGANMLGLRQTELEARIGQRGEGSVEERLKACEELVGGEGVERMSLDDTWEDETGRVRSLAMRYMPDRGKRHDPKPPKKRNPLSPLLPLLYTKRGEVAPPYKSMSSEGFVKWHAERAKNKNVMEILLADVICMEAVKDIENPVAVPPKTQRIVDAVIADRSTRQMEPAPGELQNLKRGAQIMEKVDRGDYRILRATNMGDMYPQAVPPAHLNWAQYLGQHIATLWEHVPHSIRSELSIGGGGARAPLAEGQAVEHACTDPGPAKGAASPAGGASGVMGLGGDAPGGMLSLLSEFEAADSLEEELQYRVDLIRIRFEQFAEYLDRAPEQRECVVCHQPGANCVHLPAGDYQTNGFEWDDPTCFCFTCRPCVTKRMAECATSPQPSFPFGKQHGQHGNPVP